MPMILGTFLAIVSITVIAYPFFRSKRYRMVSESFVTRERLRAERLRIYRKISDIESDFTSGDLTEADYQMQRGQLRIAAAETLKQESVGTKPDSVRDEELENEISRQRKLTVHSPEGGDTL